MNTLPYFGCFPNKDIFYSSLFDSDRNRTHELDILISRGYPPVASASTIGLLVGFSPSFVLQMGACADKYYRTFYIDKGNGEKREISTPRVALKIIQKWFGYHLSAKSTFSSAVHGFVPRRSIFTAASAHLGQDWLMSVDIKNYFGSIKIDAVSNILKMLGYEHFAREILKRLLTKNGCLPQGAPTSPLLSNYVFQECDEKIQYYANRFGFVYTRYADDLCISGKGEVPVNIEARINEIICGSGFELVHEKTKVQRRSKDNPLKLFGIILSQDELRLSKRYRNKIRLMKHLLNNNNISEDMMHIYKGHVSYSNSLDVFNESLLGGIQD